MFGSLQSRLALVVLLAMLPALVLTLGGGFAQRGLLTKDAHDHADQIAEAMQSHHVQLVADAEDLLTSLAYNPIVLGEDRAACSQLLGELLSRDDDTSYSNLAVVLPTGEMVCSAQPMNGPVYVGDRLYFRRALVSGAFAPGEHVIGRVSGRGTLLTGMPVYAADGTLTAILHAGIDLSWVHQYGSRVASSSEARIAVLDRQGQVLAHAPEVPGLVGQQIAPGPLADLISQGPPSSGELTDTDGLAYIYSLRPFQGLEDSGAVVYVSIPRDIALAAADRKLADDLATVGIVALVGLAAAWFGGEAFLLRQVCNVVQLAERLARGDLTARAGTRRSSGELGRLEHAFDDMAESLERRGAEREQIARDLAVSEARYRTVVDQVKEVIFQTDGAGLWTFLNPAWTEITGFAVAESLGTLFLNYVHPDDRALNEERFRPLINREKETCRHEIRYLTADGGFRWIEVYARLVLAADGSIVGTAGTLMDITERREATATLIRQDQLLKAAALASNHLLVTPDWRAALSDTLRLLGEAAAVDRIRVLEIQGEPTDGPVRITVGSEWVGPGLRGSTAREPGAGPTLTEVPEIPADLTFPRWLHTLMDGQPIVGRPADFPANERVLLEREGIKSLLALPIMVKGRLVGSVGFDDCSRGRSWPDVDISIFETMAGAIGGAIARQRDEEAINHARSVAERESERLLALHRASTALASPTADLDQVVEGILSSATALVDAEAASLYRWDPEAGLLRCVHNLRVPAEDTTPDMQPGVGLAGQTYARGAPLIVNDYPSWSHAMMSGRTGGLQAGIGAPLLHAGRIIGVLVVRTYSLNHRPFAEDDVRVVSLFADQAAAALENVRLHRSLEERALRLRALTRLSQRISSSLSTPDALAEIARAAARLMQAPVVTLWLVDEERGEARVGAFSEPGLEVDFPSGPVPIGRGCVGWVAEHRQPLDVDDVFLDDRSLALDWWRAHGLRSFYGVPVLHEGQLIAVLALNGRAPFRLDEEDRELLEIFIAKIAVSLRNASLFETLGETNRALAAAVERANALADQAQAADRAKSEFLSRVSHELRTPLNAILGFAQVLEMRTEDHQDLDSIHHILKGGRHLLGLINEVLDISRIESGTLHLSVEPVDAGEVVTEVLELVRPLAEARSITLTSAPSAAGSPWVSADRQRYKQILLNLVTNAVKYNRRDGQVTVTCTTLDEQTAQIAVADTGTGIERSKLDRLFDPFDRLGAESGGEEGTGLGLTITRALCQAMGGSLSVQSTVGEGTTFTVSLPLTAPQRPAAQPDQLSVAPIAAGADGLRRTVLYVEDNTPNLLLVKRVMAWRPGIELVAAPTGQAGLALAHDRHPDLVLLDLHLPDMHGREVLEALRDDPITAAVPVIVLSADASPGQVQSLLDHGADAFLTKPIVIRELLETLDAMLERAA